MGKLVVRRDVAVARLLKLHLFRQIHETLQREPQHTLDRDFVLETIVMHMPQEDYEKVFQTVVRWSRVGDLFAYDETTQQLSLQ